MSLEGLEQETWQYEIFDTSTGCPVAVIEASSRARALLRYLYVRHLVGYEADGFMAARPHLGMRISVPQFPDAFFTLYEGLELESADPHGS